MKTVEERLTELENAMDGWIVCNMALQGDIESLVEMCSLVAEKAGWREDSIAAFKELYRRKSLENLQDMLIGIENTMPAYAAKLQAIIDERKQSGGQNPN